MVDTGFILQSGDDEITLNGFAAGCCILKDVFCLVEVNDGLIEVLLFDGIVAKSV
jgi:hypothetical protein